LGKERERKEIETKSIVGKEDIHPASIALYAAAALQPNNIN
jgi:hypothetical protein